MIETQIKFTNAAIGDHADILEAIHDKSKNISILQRDLASLTDTLPKIMEEDLDFRASGTLTEITSSLDSDLGTKSSHYQPLIDDVLSLLQQFEVVTGVSSFRMLLAKVNTNMCRKFHTDVNTLRMLCTYVGPGTLWVPDEFVNYNALRRGTQNNNIILDESLVQQVKTGDVAILKGALYPEANAILHRSPTIEETGETRLLLRIDTNDTLNLWT